MTSTAFRLFVIPHTHWDREWYHSASRFQLRLVALVDALLDGTPDVRIDASKSFLLDGQTIILDDYLAVRPERERDIAVALQSGALEAGPWYVLADNLIPSGEAIIRNLEAGRRRLTKLGAHAPDVAYCPDTFGHPAAMPMIATGFGCRVAIVWRGFGGASFPAESTVWWQSADGSQLLLYHLPPDGYEFGAALPTDTQLARARWMSMAQTLKPRSTLGVALVLSGADHHAAQPQFREAVEQLQTAARETDDGVVVSGLSQAAGILVQAATKQQPELPSVQGELRDSYGYTWTLQGTLATRAHQKRRNAQLERAILTDVEPWGVLAWLHAPPVFHQVSDQGAITLAQLPVLTQHLWQNLLRTHPHDTLCGCSSDDVAQAMSARQMRVRTAIPELRTVALAGALGHDAIASRAKGCTIDGPIDAPTNGESRGGAIVLRNRSGRARGGVANVQVIESIAHVAVGPRSAHAQFDALSSSEFNSLTDSVLADQRRYPAIAPEWIGALGVVQPLNVRETYARRESPQHYPDNDWVRQHNILAWVPTVSPYGVRVVHSGAAPPTPDESIPTTTATVQGDTVRLDNGIVRISASRNGVDIEMGPRRISNALHIETLVDCGDSYTPSLRGSAVALECTHVAAGMLGPLRASVRMLWTWRQGHEQIRVITELSVDAASPVVRCRVRGVNRRRNHRLQLTWLTDVEQGNTMADAAFGPVVRQPISVSDTMQPFERPPSTMPLHRWMVTHNAECGVTVISDGLAEGESDRQRLSVTLVRAIGALSRADIPERPGHAGWPVAIPKAQCQGRFGAELGVLMHGPWSEPVYQDVEDAVDAILSPLTGRLWRDYNGAVRELSGPVLVGNNLCVSAIHLHGDGQSIILRARNLGASPQVGRWALPSGRVYDARRCRLDGVAETRWQCVGNAIEFEIGAHSLASYEVRRAVAET